MKLSIQSMLRAKEAGLATFVEDHGSSFLIRVSTNQSEDGCAEEDIGPPLVRKQLEDGICKGGWPQYLC